MSDFIRILDRFQDHESNLKSLGNEVVQRYPQSALLVELTDELHAALEGLAALRLKLGEAIDQAESEMALKANFLMQMADSPYYSKLSEKEKDTLAEHLLSRENGLASEQELLDFSLESLTQRSEEELISEISKQDLMEIGKISTPGADDFAAYDAGLAMVRDSLMDPGRHDEIVLEIAKSKLNQDPAGLIRLLYQDAFGRQPSEPEAPAPMPAQGPDGEAPDSPALAPEGIEPPPLAPETPAEPIDTLPEEVEPAMEDAPPVEEEKSEEEVVHPEQAADEDEAEEEEAE